jgi:2-succinyl-5-enolpyruvyl-6-hydroxy-3-cyclohexene-1-carboxylate synthase
VHVNGFGQRFDPDHRLQIRLEVDVDLLLDDLTGSVRAVDEASWWEVWRRFDLAVRGIVVDHTGGDRWSALGVTRSIIEHLPGGSHLVVSSSMPIRDVEWFAGDCSHVTVHANRGANGIDGVIATSLGVARRSGAPTFVLLGDVAAIHDASTLLSLSGPSSVGPSIDLRIVVINNDGGGIFHHLPQAATVDDETFESLYGTPHGIDFTALASSLRIPSVSISQPSDDLRGALQRMGPTLIEIRTERAGDVQAHRRLQESIAARLRDAAAES